MSIVQRMYEISITDVDGNSHEHICSGEEVRDLINECTEALKADTDDDDAA
jgi:hypothetical protein